MGLGGREGTGCVTACEERLETSEKISDQTEESVRKTSSAFRTQNCKARTQERN